MRPIDADTAIDRYYGEWDKQGIWNGDQDRDWLMRCIEEAPTLTLPNEPLTLNQLREMDDDPEGIDLEEIAIAYLNICGEHCNGDPAKGIPSCPFYEFPDVGMFGEPLPFGCRLEGYRNCRRRTEDD